MAILRDSVSLLSSRFLHEPVCLVAAPVWGVAWLAVVVIAVGWLAAVATVVHRPSTAVAGVAVVRLVATIVAVA